MTANAANACRIWNRSQVATSGDNATSRRRKRPRVTSSAPAAKNANKGQNGERASSSLAITPAARQFEDDNVHASEGIN